MANWIIFEKIAQWCDGIDIISGFQYDNILDSDIKLALEDTTNLKMIDSSCDWENDTWLHENTTIPEDKKHTYRVATLVSEILAGGRIQNAIELDTFCMQICCSCIANGHHRIRTMQYLGMESGPFSLNGDLDLLEELVRIGGVKCPNSSKKFVEESLIKQTKNDIDMPRQHRYRNCEISRG